VVLLPKILFKHLAQHLKALYYLVPAVDIIWIRNFTYGIHFSLFSFVLFYVAFAYDKTIDNEIKHNQALSRQANRI